MEELNKWAKLFLYIILLFSVSFLGFAISKISSEIHVWEGQLGPPYTYIYNPIFQFLGVLTIIISKVTFDNKVIKIKSSLERN